MMISITAAAVLKTKLMLKIRLSVYWVPTATDSDANLTMQMGRNFALLDKGRNKEQVGR